jgi:Protein of unknown function (DUF3179)
MNQPVSTQGSLSTEEAFDKVAYGRYKLPRRMGEAVAMWDDPRVVPGAEATHMRADDYIVGLVVGGSARAYPLWIVDNYHVINDRVRDQRIVVTSCERCQSGSAFRADVPGPSDREPLFRAVGFLNATLLMKDLRTGSYWCHYDGRGLSRRAAGVSLPWIPTYHMEWRDWLYLHPDTEVMLPPQDPRHPDARHGHGREEHFARPGMDPAFLATIVGDFDRTYPENEVVLGVDSREPVAYPLREVRAAGGVVHDRVDGRPVVVFAGPRADGFTMAAFRTDLGSRNLRFSSAEGEFQDLQTRSGWNIEGLAVSGPLEGARLEPVRSFPVRWHAWIYQRRGSRLFRHAGGHRTKSAASDDLMGFGPFLEELDQRGLIVEIEGPVVSQLRPRRSVASLTVTVRGDRLTLHRFSSRSAAADYHALDGSWSGLPLRARAREARTRRFGRLVVESDPERRCDDPANTTPLPDGSIEWSRLLTDPVIERAARRDEGGAEEASVADEGPGFLEIIRGFRLSGFEVLYQAFLPPGQLRVGCEDGIALTIEGDAFLLYRFFEATQALAYGASEPHSMVAGLFVLRSAPTDMYVFPTEILYVGDDRATWSALLTDPRFERAFRRSAQGPAVIPAATSAVKEG